jgi:hypothetical protein
MNYQDLNESQKALLMDVAIKFLMSTVDGYCANEADANKQEYATRLLLHLKSHVDGMPDPVVNSEKKLQVYKKYFETAKDNEHLVMHRGYALKLIQIVEQQQQQIEHLKTVEQAYEAYKLAH